MRINPPTETVRMWHPVAGSGTDVYGNPLRPTYDLEHSELISGVVVGDEVWGHQDADERQPDAINVNVTLYLPKGYEGPYIGCMVTLRGLDYLVEEFHVYDATGVPGPHNAWVKVVRRVGQL